MATSVLGKRKWIDYQCARTQYFKSKRRKVEDEAYLYKNYTKFYKNIYEKLCKKFLKTRKVRGIEKRFKNATISILRKKDKSLLLIKLINISKGRPTAQTTTSTFIHPNHHQEINKIGTEHIMQRGDSIIVCPKIFLYIFSKLPDEVRKSFKYKEPRNLSKSDNLKIRKVFNKAGVVTNFEKKMKPFFTWLQKKISQIN